MRNIFNIIISSTLLLTTTRSIPIQVSKTLTTTPVPVLCSSAYLNKVIALWVSLVHVA
jgi:hypothetical protein